MAASKAPAPLPNSGGRYIRSPDGALQPEGNSTAAGGAEKPAKTRQKRKEQEQQK